jgi:hypothetical protein
LWEGDERQKLLSAQLYLKALQYFMPTFSSITPESNKDELKQIQISIIRNDKGEDEK